MAALADLTVKKADETTNIVWTGVQPSSGDGTAAIWKSQTVGSAQAHQPEFRLSGREGGNGSTRVLRMTAMYPFVTSDPLTFVSMVARRNRFSAEFTLDKNIDQSAWNEFVAQVCNIMQTTTMKTYLKSGYSAT